MALWALYKIRQTEKTGRDCATALAPLKQNEARLIAIDERIFIPLDPVVPFQPFR